MLPLLVYLASQFASYPDQCTSAVYDYAEQMCYQEEAPETEASCSEFRVYSSCSSREGSQWDLGCVPEH